MKVHPKHEHVDYFMSSHFHDDHLTNAKKGTEMTVGRDPDYALSGVAEAGEWLKFGKFFDRGWPDYDYPLEVTDANVTNFRNFVRYQSESYGALQERFEPGKQIQDCHTQRLNLLF